MKHPSLWLMQSSFIVFNAIINLINLNDRFIDYNFNSTFLIFEGILNSKRQTNNRGAKHEYFLITIEAFPQPINCCIDHTKHVVYISFQITFCLYYHSLTERKFLFLLTFHDGFRPRPTFVNLNKTGF